MDDPPGTVHVFSRDEITSVPTGIRVSPHEPTINDALIVLDFAGTAPRQVVLVGVVPETLEGGMALSPRVAGAVSGAADAILREMGRADAAWQPRAADGHAAQASSAASSRALHARPLGGASIPTPGSCVAE